MPVIPALKGEARGSDIQGQFLHREFKASQGYSRSDLKRTKANQRNNKPHEDRSLRVSTSKLQEQDELPEIGPEFLCSEVNFSDTP